ncbi:DUF5594 family protein [Cupriavidus sp. 30B13]|uniref:DUF5594 family protein n=1 Tax=Cupriavidus sp. 30B13 TaxID=3384241 RepID=UPI003B91F34D
MSHDIAARFDAEFAPRIAEALAGLFRHRVHVELVRGESPARVHIHGEPLEGARRFAHPLNIYLSWDGLEIGALFAAGGEEKFAQYLAALPGKLRAWQAPRQIDFGTRSQADATVLLGGLDFEH